MRSDLLLKADRPLSTTSRHSGRPQARIVPESRRSAIGMKSSRSANAQTQPFLAVMALPDCGRREDRARANPSSALPCGVNNLKAEITWDLVMSEDMAFAEGCYRLEGGGWQVVTAVKANLSRSVSIRNVRWDSGVTGMNVILPDDARINAVALLDLMSHELGVTEWREVRGPDSMMLR